MVNREAGTAWREPGLIGVLALSGQRQKIPLYRDCRHSRLSILFATVPINYRTWNARPAGDLRQRKSTGASPPGDGQAEVTARRGT